jgi:hypothetical protein
VGVCMFVYMCVCEYKREWQFSDIHTHTHKCISTHTHRVLGLTGEQRAQTIAVTSREVLSIFLLVSSFIFMWVILCSSSLGHPSSS